MVRDKPCPHFPDCVGCPLIGNPYGTQLERKRAIVRAALDRHPALGTIEVPDVIGSPKAFGYRNQAKLVARHSPQGLLLGIYRPGSHQVVDIRRCPAHHPLIESVLDAVAREIERAGVSIYDERTQRGLLRYVIVRVSGWTKRAQIILVTADRALPDGRGLVRALQRVRGVAGVVQNVNPDPGNVILGPTFACLAGDMALIERVGDLKLRSSAGAFLQANIPVARKVYEQVLTYATLTPEESAVDLYCGVGAISFFLATRAKQVVGIEESLVAVVDAKANVRLNGFHNARFFAGPTGEVLPEVADRFGPIDVVTLNPPRKGADDATRRAIVACTPRCIVYVSCDPTTLARDLEWFGGHGYRATHVQPFDMLPQTEHVECVARLERV